jgi:cobaltochelatase CobS
MKEPPIAGITADWTWVDEPDEKALPPVSRPKIIDPDKFFRTSKTKPKETTMLEEEAPKTIFMPPDTSLKALDAVLDSIGLPAFKEIFEKTKISDVFVKKEATLTETIKNGKKENNNLNKTIAVLNRKLEAKPFEGVKVESDGVIPDGKVTMVEACKVFDGIKSKMLIPVWEWSSVHPMVPAKNPDYIFREDILMRALYALVSNQRMYLQGHTGSGKTTLLEQIAAHLNYPFIRINFDSEITRMDLIGRDTLAQECGVTVSKFVEGLLPQMMQTPCIGCFDEIDFCRPDVAYVMQSALENNSLRLTEDSGREVKPHPMFRMFATGNTVGQGDENGMYQGARPQSLAFLDRFTIWAKVTYLNEAQRFTLIKNKAETLTDDVLGIINKYTTEHLQGFVEGRILQPISPRGMIALAKAAEHLIAANPSATVTKSLKEAMYMTILDRASNGDYSTLKGIVDRVLRP